MNIVTSRILQIVFILVALSCLCQLTLASELEGYHCCNWLELTDYRWNYSLKLPAGTHVWFMRNSLTVSIPPDVLSRLLRESTTGSWCNLEILEAKLMVERTERTSKLLRLPVVKIGKGSKFFAYYKAGTLEAVMGGKAFLMDTYYLPLDNSSLLSFELGVLIALPDNFEPEDESELVERLRLGPIRAVKCILDTLKIN